MNGQEYFSINPGLFSEKNQWTYQNLKSLCKELGLGGAGKRSELELKLQRWHVARTEEDENLVPSKDYEENLPMNVLGSNFNILKIVPPNQNGNKKTKRGPLIPPLDYDDKENYNCVSPIRNNCPGTPGKSILKQDSRYETCPPSASKLQNISFSPFNKVRVIPHRIFDIESFDENENSDIEEDDDFDNQNQNQHNNQYQNGNQILIGLDAEYAEDSDSENSMEYEP